MSLMRNTLLWVSENPTMRRTLPNQAFVKKAVKRFMPGEELRDALDAAAGLKGKGISTILTHLGENISEREEAERVRDHYIGALGEISQGGHNAQVSVKLTQLGLDLEEDFCLRNLTAIIRAAAERKNTVWIDMEQSRYVDRTISIFKKARAGSRDVGLCLQSYLLRTEKDLGDLLPIEPSIRLVKGAYAEPANVAYKKKSDVDENYVRLAKTLLDSAKKGKASVGIATHDPALINWAMKRATDEGCPKENYEFQLLYGVRAEEQTRIAAEGYRIRTLISYGSFWFPWYVRRLAERPANVLFVIKNLF